MQFYSTVFKIFYFTFYSDSLIKLLENLKSERGTSLIYYKQLFNNATNADFKFIIGCKEIKVHRSILSARHCIFKDLLNTSWKKINAIMISGISFNAFWELIKFIHTGEVESLSSYIYQLILVAYKYKLTELENTCAMDFLKNIDINNVWGIFDIADSFRIRYLKQAAIASVAANKESLSSAGFKETFKSRPHLLDEILKCIEWVFK